MALEGWPGNPTFTIAQILSAESGLNWLAHNTRQLFGALLGPVTPFSGIGGSTNSTSYVTVAEYTIRHESNDLRWSFALDCTSNGTMYGKLVYNGVDVPGTTQSAAGGAYQEFNGTADITGLGLTLGVFYKVELKIKVDSFAGWGRVWWLSERSTTTPTLIAFADDVTPTTAEWQALSDAGADIMAVLDTPNAPMMSYGNNARSDFPLDWVWWGLMPHACKYFLISAGIRCHEDTDAYLKFYVDNTVRLTLRLIGSRFAPYNGGQFVTVSPGGEAAYSPLTTGEPNYTPANGEQTFIVLADTSGWGLSLGDQYKLRVALSWDDTGGDEVPDIGGAVHYIFEIPEGSPTLAGYTDPPVWNYADYVYGDTTAKPVDLLRTDAETLATWAVKHNRGAPYWTADRSDSWPWNLRKHRWLHYVNTSGDPPEIRWHNGTAWQSTSLLDSAGSRLIADLSSFAGLLPGSRYQLNRVIYAIEDSEI